MANAHGWEVLSPCGFEVMWNGGSAADDVIVRVDAGTSATDAPVALFGVGTVTFHIAGLLRTSPGWNLMIGGPPNVAKDGIAPLSGLIETDWSPFSFTMNWRLTRPHHWVRFEENEPFCFLFPVQRSAIETVEPQFLPIDSDPVLKGEFEAWTGSRDAFQLRMASAEPYKPSEKWQKFYYRGVSATGEEGTADHQTKLKLREFSSAAEPAAAISIPPSCPVARADPASETLAKRDWLLNVLEQQRRLSTEALTIYRVEGISRQAFLDEYYAVNRPVVLTGEIDDWPALQRWTTDYLREKLGKRQIVYQGGRENAADYERYKDRHRSAAPFDAYIDMIADTAGNDAYVTAYNHGENAEALEPLNADLGTLDKFLTNDCEHPRGMMWIGPANTFTPLHHDLTNNFIIQLAGRKRVVLAAPGETPKLYNDHHVFSRIEDLESPDFTLERYPAAAGLGTHTVEIGPGDILFVPIGWWHQVRALDFSVSITHTNFIWPNSFS